MMIHKRLNEWEYLLGCIVNFREVYSVDYVCNPAKQ
ncbi:MAG: hypothetical protein K0S47_635 [Herbinix sp.]|jgi:hypothetical protein|nr:hypothetical protein [Herbinix sp.]